MSAMVQILLLHRDCLSPRQLSPPHPLPPLSLFIYPPLLFKSLSESWRSCPSPTVTLHQKVGLAFSTANGCPWLKRQAPTSLLLPRPQCQPHHCRRREVFCWSHSFSFEGSRILKTNRTGFPTTCFWDPLGNLGGVGRNQVSGLSQGILVTQIMFQD